MGQFLYTLVVLLALLRPNIAEPYGRLGCRFSPVCEEEEVCVEDKLFGTCTQLQSPYLPAYKLDNVGLHKLKSTIRYLINSGYAWDDKYAQDSLRKVLDPYKREYLDVTQADVQAYIEDWLTQALEEELTWEYVEELAKDYQTMMDNYRKQQLGYKQQQQGPYMGYNDQTAGYYGYGETQGEGSEGVRSEGIGSRGVDLTYLADVAEEYLRLADKVQSEEKNNLRDLYKLYREKYKDVLQNEEEGQGFLRYPGEQQQGGNDADQEDWRILQKLQKMKENMQDIYQEHQEELQNIVGSENEGAFLSSEADVMALQDGERSEVQQENEIEDESVVVEGEMSSVGDSWGPIITETVTPSRIEELVPSETESALNELFGSYMYDQEEWNKLTEEQKEELLNKMLSALGLLEQSSLGSAADAFSSESEEGESPIELGNEVMDVPIPAGIVEKKDKQQDNAAYYSEYNPSNADSVAEEARVEVDVPADESSTETSPKDKQTTEPPSGYVFIALLFGVERTEGKRLVEELANLLNVPQSTFSDVLVNDKTITFKVNGNIMSPQEVAESAASYKRDFQEEMGLTITATGVGRETHVKVLEAPTDNSSTLVILTVVLVACVLGILIAVITVYCFRQKVKTKQKLQGLSTGAATETEASADYQDLCRQRMASKSSEKPEPLSRISSVAMSEGAQPSPSSRSSTSSWSEEPVQTNMDISTGHVVLSYMEDHLKNKDRLHEEWEALCNYEADMCSTKVGASNTSKNRHKDTLPYDHTRVVLNDSSNASRSDYINASTILDSDPRSPAYIATQAPLPTTLADFWQMVWEQGSVVIVNLCKLTETEVSRHRYWPEEGSALYHIYEVHLVSEHVWCEDYLVRSFYLKNLETQETRTVTQFHFLTWPEDSVPPSPKAALEFRRKVNKSYRGRACPIVVHCSDGIGRTGTYCLIDMVLTRMTKGAKEIDIAATLEHIRDQRPGMVKNKDQFEFALQAVAEEVNAILKALPQ